MNHIKKAARRPSFGVKIMGLSLIFKRKRYDLNSPSSCELVIVIICEMHFLCALFQAVNRPVQVNVHPRSRPCQAQVSGVHSHVENVLCQNQAKEETTHSCNFRNCVCYMKCKLPVG